MDVMIVGGGPSGLSACYNLIKKGEPDIRITLLEKQARFGGLAKSFVYDDQYVFDIGPKRFHTEDADVLAFINDVSLRCTLVEIGRSSKVHFLHKIFDWPLNIKALLRLPPLIAIKSFRDLLQKRQFTAEELLSFKNYIVMKYGQTLFDIFFKPYTEKFLQHSIEDIHSDWATTGINRSIVNKEHKGNSLFELIQRVLIPTPVKANFLYPAEKGFGAFWDACADVCADDSRVSMRTSSTIHEVSNAGNELSVTLSDGSIHKPDYLLWSGRLPDLLSAMGVADAHLPSLEYLDTIFLDLVFADEDILTKDAVCQWLYVSDGTLAISRVSFPKCLIASNIPSGKEGLCVEVTVKESVKHVDEEELMERVLQELKDLKILRADAVPLVRAIHRESSTYPIYHREYRKAVADAVKTVESFSDKIILMGRCGSYWYNNSDHSIKQSLKITDDVLSGDKPLFDCYGWFGSGIR